MTHNDPFESRRLGYEEQYFRTKEAEMVGKLREVFEAKREKEDLSKATGITSDDVLDRMMAASVSGEMLTAFKLYPLVEIAWADGGCDKKEAEAAISAAIKHGVAANSPALARLKVWLDRGPTEDARAAWYMYAGELRKSLSKAELDSFRTDLMKTAQTVAETSGGIFGVYFSVTGNERAVMKKIEEALTK